MGLVGMLMREEHRVDVVDIRLDQLFAQIRRRVDHDARGALGGSLFRQQGAAQASVFGVSGIAGAPAERRTRDSG